MVRKTAAARIAVRHGCVRCHVIRQRRRRRRRRRYGVTVKRAIGCRVSGFLAAPTAREHVVDDGGGHGGDEIIIRRTDSG